MTNGDLCDLRNQPMSILDIPRKYICICPCTLAFVNFCYAIYFYDSVGLQKLRKVASITIMLILAIMKS